ncbi:MAG: AbrB/MazE/SpoVT family DNA-binding domain-containing protein [Vicinamibacteria bacterium]
MDIAQSRLTAQGQISVPAVVRKKLGVGPGGTLEWHDEGGTIVVRRSGWHSSEDIHKALFASRPKRRSLGQLKAGIKTEMARRRAGR